MRKTKLIFFVLILSLFCSVSLVWSSGGAEAVKIGALIPLTGPLAEFAQGFRLAGQLAETQFLKAGFPVDVI